MKTQPSPEALYSHYTTLITVVFSDLVNSYRKVNIRLKSSCKYVLEAVFVFILVCDRTSTISHSVFFKAILNFQFEAILNF